MKSTVLRPCPSRIRRQAPNGYTIVEILVAITISLVMMVGVATIFGTIGQSIADSRATLEMSNRLRTTQLRLQEDLANVTVPVMEPPRDPQDFEGYFEVTEGPIGPAIPPTLLATNLDQADPTTPSGFARDTTVGDLDDMLMFTARSKTDPFAGRVFVKRWPQPGEQAYYDPTDPTMTPVPDTTGQFVVVRTAKSEDAEIAWFVRGTTLYRRVLLVLPQFDADLRVSGTQMQLDTRRDAPYTPPFPEVSPAGPGFHNDYDISIRSNNNTEAFANFAIQPNTLGDLTKPENRYAHRIEHRFTSGAAGLWSGYPFHPHFYLDWTVASPPAIAQSPWYSLGLPTLNEASFRIATGHVVTDPDPLDPAQPLNYSASWMAGWPLTMPLTLTARPAPLDNFDAWINRYTVQELNAQTGTLSGYTSTRQMQTRISEDAILTNVIGFDVKVWDPGAPVLLWNPSGTAYTLAPGDPRYAEAIRNLSTGTAPVPTVVSYGAYVDLNYMCLVGPQPSDTTRPYYNAPSNVPAAQFHGPGQIRSRLPGTMPYARNFSNPTDWPTALRSSVFDTWSTHYERDEPEWIDRNGDGNPQFEEFEGDQDRDGFYNGGTNIYNEGANGFDDAGITGVVDDANEMEAPPPYPHPLRGIQVKIRVFEPDSRQIREVTVVEEFVGK